MNCKGRISVVIRTLVIITLFLMMSGLCCQAVYADEEHISVDCTPGEISVGDTFSIVLSTSDMTVSTFTGYVQYDESFVRYVSFESVSLSDKNGNRIPLTVGANEDAPYFGFGFFGASDTACSAQNGFLTLTFQAVGVGIPVFIIGEDSDGKDGTYSEVEYVPDIIINDDHQSDVLREVVDLVITEEPDKTAYSSGEYFDGSGMVVTAVYSDGTSEVITDYVIYDKTLSPDDTDIQIEYGGVKIKLPITVDGSSEDNGTGTQNEEGNHGNMVLLICIVAGIVLIAVILFLVLFLGKRQKNVK